jgi:predicted lipid-binding transport protein (Tim44 family)
MGPLAGLAAGLGLAALASHFGFGEALANMMLIGLLVMGVLLVVAMVMRKRAAAQAPAMAGGGMFRGMSDDNAAPAAGTQGASAAGTRIGSGIGSAIGSGIGSGVAASSDAGARTGNIPAGFDTAAFVRSAKEQFMGLQRANDAGDIDRLRDYLTPDMLTLVREELDARGNVPQATDVFGLDAQVLDVAEEADRYVVSVRFTGSVRDQQGAVPEDLDEIWHLTKPRAGFGGWVIAGIQQTSDATRAA